MGCWGMGMTQTDESYEVYEEFMDSYNEGKEPAEISAAILAEYHEEFSDDDGIMHDVYFALAKAEWMCCAQSESVLKRVQEIIDSGANIAFYRELEASEKDLKLRQKKLQAFWDSLQTPRAKPRQRRINPLDREAELPPMEVGECYRYKYKDGYRVFVVLGFIRLENCPDEVQCGLFKKTYTAAELKTTDFLLEPLRLVANYSGEDLLAACYLEKFGTIPISKNRYRSFLSSNALIIGQKRDFKATYSTSAIITPEMLLAGVKFPVD